MNIICINNFTKDLMEYKSKISKMEKAELLCELLEYHNMMRNKSIDYLSMKKGIELLKVLKECRLTPSLNILVNKYYDQFNGGE